MNKKYLVWAGIFLGGMVIGSLTGLPLTFVGQQLAFPVGRPTAAAAS